MSNTIKQPIFTVFAINIEGQEDFILDFNQDTISVEKIMSIMDDFVKTYKNAGKQIDLLDMIKEIEEENGRGNKA
jgi:hypothetical protein